MKLVHPKIESEVRWDENIHAWELVIENPKFLRSVLRDFSEHHLERDINFVVDGQSVKFESEIETIYNPFALDFNNRRAMAALLKIILNTSNAEEMYVETVEMKAKILKYMEGVIDESKLDFEVATSDFLVDALAKAVNVHIVGDEDNFCQLLMDYMVMMRDLVKVKIFCFVGLRSILSKNELSEFIASVYNHQIDVLLIENHANSAVPGVRRVTIDEDLCEV
jgi:CRISPR type II-A-associated protein Csn2